MSYEIYKKLCDLLFEGEGDGYAFTHVFLTLEWNLIARRNKFLSMNVNHVQWENDILVFYFSKTKGDQSGDNSGDMCYVNSNTKNPELCSISALESIFFHIHIF